MTAINVIFDRDVVHVFTDGLARNQSDGTPVHLATKVFPMPHISAVMCARGDLFYATGVIMAFQAALPLRCSTYDVMKECALDALHRAHVLAAQSPVALRIGGEFCVAGLSETTGPDCYWIFTDERPDRGEMNQPWCIHNTSPGCAVPGDRQLMDDWHTAHVNESPTMQSQGLSLMELQRVRSWPGPMPGGVGGFVQHTTVQRDGITSRIIHRWPLDP